jgi:hypothetical protein
MIVNKVKIDLNVFGALMLDGVCGHVDGANMSQNRTVAGGDGR